MPEVEAMSINDALALAIAWHDPDTRAFVAKYGHGMSGREMVALLREAKFAGIAPHRCEAGSGACGPALYCGWDKQWLCENHTTSDRHASHRLAMPMVLEIRG